MIECPSCKIHFSPRYKFCPRCKKYEAALKDRVEYLGDSVEAALDRGASAADVEAMLVEEGVSPQEACEMVAARSRKVKRAERSYGLFRLLGGSAILLVGLVPIIWGICLLPSYIGKRSITAGVVICAVGAGPFYLGLYSVLTGREKK